MTTLADLLQQCGNLLGDTSHTVFPTAQLTDWINRAVEDLSVHFPMFAQYDISTTLNCHVYELETVIKGVASVEYPTAQTPPRYLKRKSFTETDFYLLPGYYDFVKMQSDDSDNPPLFYISDNTPAGKTASIMCATDHAVLTTGADATTVLARHVHLIGLFVRWKAYSERSSHDMMDPSPLSTRFSNMEIAVTRSEQAYKDALNRAITAEADSAISSWQMDKYGQIY